MHIAVENQLVELQKAVVARANELVPNASPDDLLTLTEAVAWIVAPAQSHGGTSKKVTAARARARRAA